AVDGRRGAVAQVAQLVLDERVGDDGEARVNRRAHVPGRLSLTPGRAGLRERLTTLAPRSEVRRPKSVQARTVLGPPNDGSRRQRRPGNVSKLTPRSSRTRGKPGTAGVWRTARPRVCTARRHQAMSRAPRR